MQVILNTIHRLSKTRIYIFLLFILISFFLYGNTIKGNFVYDDALFTYRTDLRDASQLTSLVLKPYIPNNPESGAWRPLGTISTALQFIITGESPMWFHVTNIFLNGFITFFVYIIVYQLFHKRTLALITALLFAFLPVHTETVAFIKSREDLFAANFFLLSWILFNNAMKKAPYNLLQLILSAFLILFSFLAKETYIFGPFLFIFVYIVQHSNSFKTLKYFLIYVPSIIGYFLLRSYVLGTYAFGMDNSSFIMNPIKYVDTATKIWTAFQILSIYISTIFFPFNLSASYHYNQVPLIHNPLESTRTIIGIGILILFIILLLYKKTRNTPIGIGILIFLIPYLVISKFFFTAGEFMAERWMYIPSLGLILILGYLLTILIKRQKILRMLLLIIILLYSTVFIFKRNNVWLSSESLYQSMVKSAPQSVQAHYLLATLNYDKKNFDIAEREVDSASQIYPDYAPLLNLQSKLSLQKNDFQAAEVLSLKAVELDPTYFQTFITLSLLYYGKKDYQKVVEVFKSIIPHSHGMLSLTHMLVYATSLAKNQQYEQSLQILNEYQLDLTFPEVQFLYALNYYKLGNNKYLLDEYNWDNTITQEEKIKIFETF